MNGVPVMPTVGAIASQPRSHRDDTAPAPRWRNDMCQSGGGASPEASVSNAYTLSCSVATSATKEGPAAGPLRVGPIACRSQLRLEALPGVRVVDRGRVDRLAARRIQRDVPAVGLRERVLAVEERGLVRVVQRALVAARPH